MKNKTKKRELSLKFILNKKMAEQKQKHTMIVNRNQKQTKNGISLMQNLQPFIFIIQPKTYIFNLLTQKKKTLPFSFIL